MLKIVDYDVRMTDDRILLKTTPASEKTEGGLHLHPDYQQSPRIAEVIAIGPGLLRMMPFPDGELRHPMQCNAGDQVFVPHQMEVVRTDPRDKTDCYCICRDSDIIAILGIKGIDKYPRGSIVEVDESKTHSFSNRIGG